ncbi:hypothetical protein pb186bvf_014892 [Paramecium bursaria]
MNILELIHIFIFNTNSKEYAQIGKDQPFLQIIRSSTFYIPILLSYYSTITLNQRDIIQYE